MNGPYNVGACRLMIVRMVWDAVIDYVLRVEKPHKQAQEFLFSPGGQYLFECLQIDYQAALNCIQAKRDEFTHKAVMAYVDPAVYEDELRRWCLSWYGTGFPAAV